MVTPRAHSGLPGQKLGYSRCTPFSQQKGLYSGSVIHSTGTFILQKRRLRLPMGLKASRYEELTLPDNFYRQLAHQFELLGTKQPKDSLNDKDAFSFLPDGKAEYQENSNPLCRLSRAEAPVYFSVG